MAEAKKAVHVGVCGAGLGGLAAAIAIARSGASVTLLESAPELGEVGAGIQMTPNVSRFLVKWGVADIIGPNLVQPKMQRMWRSDCTLIQQTEIDPLTIKEFGFPWWVVHRGHLHAGLVEAAKRHGVTVQVDSRVASIEYEADPVTVTTTKGDKYSFDLLVGADGLKSTTRRTLFPEVHPTALTASAAYRFVLPYEQVFREVPEARELFGEKCIDSFLHPGSYVITYPIADRRDMNLVLSHLHKNKVHDVEEADIADVKEQYAEYHPTIRKIVDLVTETKRWPLLQLPRLKSWSSPRKNVVLMGDAAHAMVNHIAQGAATAMEDGAFLGRVIADVLRDNISMPEAVTIYEQTRMPRAWIKQQASFLMGNMEYLQDHDSREARDKSGSQSLAQKTGHQDGFITGPGPNRWSWNIFGAPDSISHVAGYDADADADFAVLRYLSEKEAPDPHTGVAPSLEKKWTGTFLPKAKVGSIGNLSR